MPVTKNQNAMPEKEAGPALNWAQMISKNRAKHSTISGAVAYMMGQLTESQKKEILKRTQGLYVLTMEGGEQSCKAELYQMGMKLLASGEGTRAAYDQYRASGKVDYTWLEMLNGVSLENQQALRVGMATGFELLKRQECNGTAFEGNDDNEDDTDFEDDDLEVRAGYYRRGNSPL